MLGAAQPSSSIDPLPAPAEAPGTASMSSARGVRQETTGSMSSARGDDPLDFANALTAEAFYSGVLLAAANNYHATIVGELKEELKEDNLIRACRTVLLVVEMLTLYSALIFSMHTYHAGRRGLILPSLHRKLGRAALRVAAGLYVLVLVLLTVPNLSTSAEHIHLAIIAAVAAAVLAGGVMAIASVRLDTKKDKERRTTTHLLINQQHQQRL